MNVVRGRGFTLIELMIVVAIIGILAVLAIYGVRAYLATSKNAEAFNNIGAINRAAVAAYEREQAPAEVVTGQSSQKEIHALCASSNAVPNNDAAIQNKKYTPDPTPGQDFMTAAGPPPTGWMCLKFTISQPMYYRYQYVKGGTAQLATNAQAPGGADWLVEARGDLDGNGIFSGFIGGGKIANGQAITATEVATAEADE